MNLFEKIKNSVYGPSYYKELLSQPLSYSFKYFFYFSLMLCLIGSLVAFFAAAPTIKAGLEQMLKIGDKFPEDLQITVKDGKAQSNVKEPYFVKMPQELAKAAANENVHTTPNIKNYENLAVVNTQEPVTLEKFNSFNTAVLAGQDGIMYENDKHAIEVAPYKQFGNMVLDKKFINDKINKIKPFSPVAYPLVALGFFAMGLIICIAKLSYLIVGACIIWLVAKIKGVNLQYIKAYQFGLHLMALPMIILAIQIILGIKGFWLEGSALLAIMSYINIKTPGNDSAMA